MSSPVNPNTLKAFLPNSTGNQCDNFMKALIAFPLHIWKIFNWMLDSAGNFTDAFQRMIHPAGQLMMSASVLEQPGWLLCDGRSLDKNTYPDLYAAIGDVYNADETVSPNFNIPDFRTIFPCGVGTNAAGNRTYALGDSGGTNTVALTANENGPHTHTAAVNQNNGGAGYFGSTGSVVANGIGVTLVSGSGQAHENRPPYLAVNFYIKT